MPVEGLLIPYIDTSVNTPQDCQMLDNLWQELHTHNHKQQQCLKPAQMCSPSAFLSSVGLHRKHMDSACMYSVLR